MTATTYGSKAVIAENSFLGPIQVDAGQRVAFSISDPNTNFTSATTVVLQRRYNPAGNWRTVKSWVGASTGAGAVEYDYLAYTGMELQIGVATGGLHSGDTVTVEYKTGNIDI